MGAQIPTLTTTGWVSDPSSKANAMMDYFITSEVSQTHFYPGRITSLPGLVQKYAHQPQQLSSHVERKLHGYFTRYFDEAIVEVSATDLESEDGQYNLDIDVVLVEGNVSRSLGHLVRVGQSGVISYQSKG